MSRIYISYRTDPPPKAEAYDVTSVLFKGLLKGLRGLEEKPFHDQPHTPEEVEDSQALP